MICFCVFCFFFCFFGRLFGGCLSFGLFGGGGIVGFCVGVRFVFWVFFGVSLGLCCWFVLVLLAVLIVGVL